MSTLIYVCNLNATVGGICSASTCVLAAEAPLLEGGCVRVLSGSVPALFFNVSGAQSQPEISVAVFAGDRAGCVGEAASSAVLLPSAGLRGCRGWGGWAGNYTLGYAAFNSSGTGVPALSESWFDRIRDTTEGRFAIAVCVICAAFFFFFAARYIRTANEESLEQKHKKELAKNLQNMASSEREARNRAPEHLVNPLRALPLPPDSELEREALAGGAAGELRAAAPRARWNLRGTLTITKRPPAAAEGAPPGPAEPPIPGAAVAAAPAAQAPQVARAPPARRAPAPEPPAPAPAPRRAPPLLAPAPAPQPPPAPTTDFTWRQPSRLTWKSQAGDVKVASATPAPEPHPRGGRATRFI